MTLPAIYLLRNGSEAAREQLLGCFGDPEPSADDLSAVVAAMRACGALDATHAVAKEYADRAREGLEGLEDSRPKQALAELPEFVLSRQM